MEISINPSCVTGGVVVLALLAVIIWLGWGRDASMPNAATTVARGTIRLVGAIVLVGMIWFCWEFRPWMPAGRTVHLLSERIGDQQFQVWQRKNSDLIEAFATGLFVRKQSGEPWQVFLVDFEDAYRPPIVLRREGSRIGVFYGNDEWGYFDPAQQRAVRRHHADGRYHPLSPFAFVSEPPGDWWLKESRAGE